MAFSLKSLLAGFAALAGTAILWWFGTGLNPWWPWLWLAPIPILLVAQRAKFWPTLLCALLGLTLGGLNLWHYAHAVLGLPLGMAATPIVGPAVVVTAAVLVFRSLAQRGHLSWALLSFPALVTAFEALFEHYSPHGTGGSMAYSELGCLPILQLASVTGPAGITFAVLLFAAATALLIGAGTRARAALVACGALAVALLWGTWRLAQPVAGPSVPIGLVSCDQPEHLRMAKPGNPTLQLWEAYRPSVLDLAHRGAAVVVLPEKLGTEIEAAPGDTDAFWQKLAEQAHVQIVVGLERQGRDGLAYNEARAYGPGLPVGRYDKEHMLPPFENKYTPGTTLLPLTSLPAATGVAICKDLDFPAPANRYGAAGMGLVLAPAWDFSVDRVYHGHMAIMRGVESGFSIARTAKLGNLTVSDSRGRILAERQSDAEPFSTLLVTIPGRHVDTPYLKLGDSFGAAAIVLALLCLVRLAMGAKAVARR